MGAASITGNQKLKASPAWNWLNQKELQQIRTKTTAHILLLLCTIEVWQLPTLHNFIYLFGAKKADRCTVVVESKLAGFVEKVL